MLALPSSVGGAQGSVDGMGKGVRSSWGGELGAGEVDRPRRGSWVGRS